LEDEVRQKLSHLDAESVQAFPKTGDEAGVLAEGQEQCRQLRRRLAQLDKRLDQCIDAGARGRLSREKMRALSLDLAAQRLETEERLQQAERRAQEQASLAAHQRAQAQALDRLVATWDALDFNARRSSLREVVDRVVVRDDEIRVLLRP
jgi:hypothetical protein